MIRCAGLVHLNENKDQLLLVKVRENRLLYLAGGKIEIGEQPEQALIRELEEELNIQLIPETIQHITTIVAPAYPQNDSVELHCFSAQWLGEITPQAEISSVEYIPLNAVDKMAPAVQKLVVYLQTSKNERI